MPTKLVKTEHSTFDINDSSNESGNNCTINIKIETLLYDSGLYYFDITYEYSGNKDKAELFMSIMNTDDFEGVIIIKNEMTSVTESDLHSFSTPLTVDVNTGDNLGILH